MQATGWDLEQAVGLHFAQQADDSSASHANMGGAASSQGGAAWPMHDQARCAHPAHARYSDVQNPIRAGFMIKTVRYEKKLVRQRTLMLNMEFAAAMHILCRGVTAEGCNCEHFVEQCLLPCST